MVKCAIKNYSNKSGRKACSNKVTFHRFPKCEATRKIWLTNIGLTEAMLSSIPVLCSEYFEKEAFDRRSVNRVHLKPNSIPFPHTTLMEVDQQEITVNVSEETFSPKRCRFDEEEIKTESDIQHCQTKSTSISPNRFKVDKATAVSPNFHFNSPRKTTLREMLKEQAQQHSKTVSALKQKVQRQEKKIASIVEILHTLQEKYLDEHQVDILGLFVLAALGQLWVCSKQDNTGQTIYLSCIILCRADPEQPQCS
ncbi:uncharacterized protein [Linepithema humile]|uniref:uncharacterized protein isoform X2 n=1 Tax=Linepithema humile TaxID=83485 RepID=UPI00351E035C